VTRDKCDAAIEELIYLLKELKVISYNTYVSLETRHFLERHGKK
jgi:hypothetical protein